MPAVALDFFFMGSDDLEGTLPGLVIKDRETRMLFSYLIPGRGSDLSWVAEQVATDIKKLGHAKTVIRTDNEQAMIALVRRISAHGVEVIPEGSVPNDDQSKRFIERGVQSIEDRMHALKLGLEENLKAKIPINHPIVTWLAPHAGEDLL